ncbi:hypothetical protein DFH28DRAFT_886171, partial [Melampsora americana]
VWSFCREVTDGTTKDSLGPYLSKDLEERKRSDPFLSLQHIGTKGKPFYGLDVIVLMNSMLQSKYPRWTELLPIIFKMSPSHQDEYFWKFIGELSDYMPTPALQITFCELEKERKKPWYFQRFDTTGCEHETLDDAISKCALNMKEHITSIRNNVESERIINIFTRKEQGKLGEHRIELETKWREIEEMELFQYWALSDENQITHLLWQDMNVYTNVRGDVKGLLETQAVLTGTVKAGKLASLEITALPYELRQPVENWFVMYTDQVANKLLNHINRLDDLRIQCYSVIQETLGDGLTISKFFNVNDTKQVMKFWTKNFEFYLAIRYMPKLEVEIHPLEELICKDPEHMGNVMKEFKKITRSLNTQNDMMFRFLEFFLEKTRSHELRRIAEDGLASIRKIQPKDFEVI